MKLRSGVVAIVVMAACSKAPTPPVDAAAAKVDEVVGAKVDEVVSAKVDDAGAAGAAKVDEVVVAKVDDAVVAKVDDAGVAKVDDAVVAKTADVASPAPPEGELRDALKKYLMVVDDDRGFEVVGDPEGALIDPTWGVYVDVEASMFWGVEDEVPNPKPPNKVWFDGKDLLARAKARAEDKDVVRVAAVEAARNLIRDSFTDEFICSEADFTCQITRHPTGTLYRFGRTAEGQIRLVGVLFFDVPADDAYVTRVVRAFDTAVEKRVPRPAPRSYSELRNAPLTLEYRVDGTPVSCRVSPAGPRRDGMFSVACSPEVPWTCLSDSYLGIADAKSAPGLWRAGGCYVGRPEALWYFASCPTDDASFVDPARHGAVNVLDGDGGEVGAEGERTTRVIKVGKRSITATCTTRGDAAMQKSATFTHCASPGLGYLASEASLVEAGKNVCKSRSELVGVEIGE
jgi:hypothetical protein